MKITYRTGDLLLGPERCILHGCNARGVMGRGIAAAIRQRYPKAFERYREVHETEGLKLGAVIVAEAGGRVILNAITQQEIGREPGRVYVSYEAIRDVMRFANGVPGLESVAMPLVGAGLAQGDWPTIAGIIEAEFTAVRPIVYTLDGKVPG